MGTCSGKVTIDTLATMVGRSNIAYGVFLWTTTVIGVGGAAYILCCRKNDRQKRGCWVKGMSVLIITTLVFI